MSILTKILEKLGLKKPETTGSTSGASKDASHRPGTTSSAPSVRGPSAAPISEVDVVQKLETLAADYPAPLNWKVSIVDLLKLLDLDSSYEDRKELAVELGAPSDFMNDSAKMNTWLHKEVLRRIAQNGGNIPKELLD